MAKTRSWDYTVEGGGAFPIDMLRYDEAVPATETDSNSIHLTLVDRRLTFAAIRLRSYFRPPTAGRWESFGWRVTKLEARS